MLQLGSWSLHPGAVLVWLQTGLAGWLTAHPLRAPLLLAACMVWAARRDSWRVHILPVPGLLAVALLRLAAILALWEGCRALPTAIWHGSLLLAVQGCVLLSAVLLLRGALFLVLLSGLRLVLVLALAGAGTLHRRQRVVDRALRLAEWLERHAAGRQKHPRLNKI